MQKFIFNFGLVSVLIAGGFLAVYAFVFSGFFTKSEAATDDRIQSSRVSRTQNRPSESDDVLKTDLPEAEYKSRLARIKQSLDEGNFEELVKQGDEIQKIWATDGGERFAKLILEV